MQSSRYMSHGLMKSLVECYLQVIKTSFQEENSKRMAKYLSTLNHNVIYNFSRLISFKLAIIKYFIDQSFSLMIYYKTML